MAEDNDHDSRVFEPLPPGHPAIWEPCGICRETFVAGDVTMLVPKNEWTPGSGMKRAGVSPTGRPETMTVEGALVHRRCYETARRVLGHRATIGPFFPRFKG